MPETSVQRRDEALPDKSGVSMSSISLSLEAETCPEDVRFVRYSRQLCNIVGSVKTFASENPLTQLRLRALDLARQVAPGTSFPLSLPINGA